MTTFDYLQEALTQLQNVHGAMLNALLESQKGPSDTWILSEDFAELNALHAKLEALSDRFAPAYTMPTFDELVAASCKPFPSREQYLELEAAALAADATQEDIDMLGTWYERFGYESWNGEYYDVDGVHQLRPIDEEDADGDWHRIGWDLR